MRELEIRCVFCGCEDFVVVLEPPKDIFWRLECCECKRFFGRPLGEEEKERRMKIDYPVRRGRPRKGYEDKTLAHRKPWLAIGVSERTYYRHKKRDSENG